MKPDSLPIFPLELVLYPNESRALHIFEDRYRDLVRDCLQWNVPFGIVLIQDGKLEKTGCTADIVRVAQEYDDGRKDIVVEGRQRFQIVDLKHEHSYLTADIEPLEDQVASEAGQSIERVIAQHIKLLELAGRMPRPTEYQDRRPLSFFIAHNAGLTLIQKQQILEMNKEQERISYLEEHLEKFIPAVEAAETVRQKVRSNGHFQDFPPP